MELNVKRKKIFIIGMIACFVLTVALLLIAFLVTTLFDSPTSEVNTLEFNATFDRIEKDRKEYFIYVDEYECKLMLPAMSILDADYLLQLDKGELIYFRIYDVSQDLLNSSTVEQLAIVTFKTAERDIVTFDSYNKFEKRQVTNAKVTGIVFAIIFALGGFYCILKLNGGVFLKKRHTY